jgi:hypothetical protein
LVMQLVGILVTTAWVAGHSLAAWFVLRLLNIHRVSEAAEKDLFHHTVEMAKFAGSMYLVHLLFVAVYSSANLALLFSSRSRGQVGTCLQPRRSN